ncbi:hypothetical protein [Azospirillum sp.]|uniref:hypothetical protein n=1 Tax=Azospirillum sp. TaxID=34012 RepID=UPI003D75BF50
MIVRPPTNDGLLRRLAAGYGMQGINLAVLLSLQLLVVPIFLHFWSMQAYGRWLALNAAAGFFGLADFGVVAALGNRLRAAWSRGEAEMYRRLFQVGLGVCSGLTVAGTALLLASASILDVSGLLGLTEEADAETTFVLLGLMHLLGIPRALVVSIYSARGEHGRETGVNLIYFGAMLVVPAASAGLGGGLLGTAAANLAASVLLGWGVVLADVRRRYADLPLRIRPPNRGELAELVARAPFYSVTATAALVHMQMPVVLLGLMAEPGATVAFTTMRTFTGLTRQAATQLFIVASLEMARQHAQRDAAGIVRMYAESGRMIGGLSGLLMGMSMVLGPAFFVLWTKGAVAFDPVLAGIFLGTTLALGPSLGSTWLLRHTDHPRTLAAAFALQIPLGAGLCVALLAAGLGPVGAALAVGAAELVTPGLRSVAVVGRLLEVRMLTFLGPLYGTAVLSLLFGAGAALAADWLAPPGSLSGLMVTMGLWTVLAVGPAYYLLLDARQRTTLVCRLAREFR